MSNLEDTVRSVVEDLTKSNELFTALDVSNKVKLTMPFARHREVREVVRGLFASEIEPKGWARSPIEVTLPNGNKETALLYHPLADSWDLDTKYDAQKRTQAALNPVQQAVVAVTPVVVASPTPVVVAAPVVPVPLQSARQQWDSLFKTQPSLFPSR